MPVFEQSFVFEAAKRLRVFLELRVGATRGAHVESMDSLKRDLAGKEREISALRKRLASNVGAAGGANASGMKPGNIVWVFGAARTGSTWLSQMMADMDGCEEWMEPYVGEVFGTAYFTRATAWMRSREEYILSDIYKNVWLRSIRNFVLEGVDARFPSLDGKYLVMKEPNGTIGAPLLSGAFPESRIVLLIRDPRDIVASLLAANKKGSWGAGSADASLANDDTDRFVHARSQNLMRILGKAKEAYESHPGPKTILRYENLRRDTFVTMSELYRELDMAFDDRRLRNVVEKHDWENIPEQSKGDDKPRRKAEVGGWRADLSDKQTRIVEESLAPFMDEFYARRGTRP